MTNPAQIEEWRGVSYAMGYEVSSTGRVASWYPERHNAAAPSERRVLKEQIDADGYRTVTIRVNGAKRKKRTAVLVAEAWHGARPAGQVVRHLDGSKDNDTPDNLAWGTIKENSSDARDHGTLVIGERVNTSRLDEEKVRFVKTSPLGLSELARLYGVTPGAIWHIRAGRTWKHVTA